MWTPCGTHSERQGNTLRLYAAARYVRPDGVTWTPVHEVVQYAELPGQGYQVNCMGKWVRLLWDPESADLLAAATTETIRRPSRFGPVLDAAQAPDAISWQIQASDGVTLSDNGDVVLAELDGVKLGLFLADWRNTFGDRCVVDGGAVSLDLTAHKAASARINLDPTTVAAGDQTGGLLSSSDNTTWADLYAGNCAVVDFGTLRAGAFQYLGWYALDRGFIQFNTAGVGAIASATLKLTPKELCGSANIYFDVIPDYGTLDLADWNATPGTRVGTKAIADMVVGTEFSFSVPSGEINQSGKTCFLLRSQYDTPAAPPAGVRRAEFEDDDDAHPPVLEMTFPPVGGGRSSGAGASPVADTFS
jgi:hypothetical protein